MLVREAFVFMHLKGCDVLAGKIQHVRESRADRFYFGYGKSYLARDDAVSIDPRRLPLSPDIHVYADLPLAFQDAGPDDFGRYLYEHLHGRRAESPLDYLIDNGRGNIGAVSFSQSQTGPQDSRLITLTSLDELAEAYFRLEAHKPLSSTMRRLLLPGTSLPGARPKALLEDEFGDQWIVKFSRPNDLFNIPVAEYAAMTAGAKMFRTASVRLETLGKHSVFLVKRFDREGENRRHFLSAYTLLGADQATPESFYRSYGYPAISQLIKQASSLPNDDRAELYRRMVFNAVVGNRDDHLKNHGFLKDPAGSLYRLSPAYDIVPGAGGRAHAIALSADSATATLDALLASHEIFGVSREQALEDIEQASDLGSDLLTVAAQAGMNQQELQLVEQGMMRMTDGRLKGRAERI